VVVNAVEGGQRAAGGGRRAVKPLDALDAVAPGAPRYEVPRLSETPLGISGLLRWGQSLVEGRGPRIEGRASGSKQRVGARAAPHKLTSSHARTLARGLLAESLTIVGGKGGVGKTTTACALAIEAAALATPVLLVSTDPAPSVADALGQPVNDAETEVAGVSGLLARQMDATAAFREFQQGYQQRVDDVFDAFMRRGVDAAQDRGILRDLLALAPPGIDEVYALAMLGETLAEGRFARVIVDPAPTGHLLRLLQMPALALDWSHRLMRLMLKYRDVGGLGDMAEELLAFTRRTRRLDELLHHAPDAGLVVVALDEPLVRGETARLVAATRAEGVDVRAVLWNRGKGPNAPAPLPAVPPVAQFVAPAATPPPIGATALRAWAGHWREHPEVDG
jgi:arsenite-transporting ATPase